MVLPFRPDDYFAEMAKSDEHMQKIRENLLKKEAQQRQSEKVKQLRLNKKEGKALQIQKKLERQNEKKEMLDQIKKYRKGVSKNLDFLDGKQKKIVEKRKQRDKKFGFGGKKRGSKLNTKDSAADVSEYRRSDRPKGKQGNKKMNKGGKHDNKRPGKNRRIKNKARGKKK